MTFRQFLMTKKDDDSHEGDLAQDVLRDKFFKGKRITVKSVEKRILQSGGTYLALIALEAVVAKYKKVLSKF